MTETVFYNTDYHKLLKFIMEQPEEFNNRTNTYIKAYPGLTIGYRIDKTLPLINTRRMFPVTAFAELCWTLSGERKLDWLQQHTKMWDNFKNSNNEIEAAYGYRWRKMFGRDQLIEGLQALKKDSSDRQIFISAWDNSRDGLGNRWTSNVPCPVCFTLNIIQNKLNLSLFLRSSDIIVGLPYDLMMYGLLLIACTNELKKEYPHLTYGSLNAHLANAHIYAPHFSIARKLIEYHENKSLKKINQSIDLKDMKTLWELQTVSNIIKDRNTAMLIFKDCLYKQFGPNELRDFPPLFKPEIIL